MRLTSLLWCLALVLLLRSNLAAQTLTQITKNGPADQDLNPVLSSDGRYLAWFSRGRGGRTRAIYVLDTASHRLTSIAPQVPAIQRMCMSGDGRTLFYIHHGAIWSVSTSGGWPHPVRRTGGGVAIANALSASYDGSKLCYAVQSRGGLEVVDVVTGQVVVVTRSLPFVPRGVTGDLSGDGRFVVFAAGSATGTQLWFAGVDGTLIRRLQPGAVTFVYGPNVDHFGTICAFEAVVNGIYRVFSAFTNGGLVRVTSPGTLLRSRGPVMAANGDRVIWLTGSVHMAHPGGAGHRPLAQIGGMNPDTSHYLLRALNGDGTVAAMASVGSYRGGNPERDYEIYLWRDALTRTGSAAPGRTVTFHIQDASQAGASYVARCALSRSPGIPLPGVGTIPLTPDALFFLSGRAPSIFRNFAGVLDAATGTGTYSVAIPADPGLTGLAFFTTFIAVGRSASVYPALKVIVQ